MRKFFYKLEYVNFFETDLIDNENVEDRLFIGIFSSLKKLNEEIFNCLNYQQVTKANFDITKFIAEIDTLPKHFYVLYHEYAILNENGGIVDYYYSFTPKTSKKEVLKQKSIIKKQKKFAYKEGRDYSSSPPDGYEIVEYTLNQNYFLGPRLF